MQVKVWVVCVCVCVSVCTCVCVYYTQFLAFRLLEVKGDVDELTTKLQQAQVQSTEHTRTHTHTRTHGRPTASSVHTFFPELLCFLLLTPCQ